MPRTTSPNAANSSIPHARDSAPWSGPSPSNFPEWGTLFARKLGPAVFALYYDRECEKHFARHAIPEEVEAGEAVQSGRRFDVIDVEAPHALGVAGKRAA